MSQKSLGPALQRWLTTQAHKLLSDGELLDRFRRQGEEAAFAALLERHGPMVRGVCARILRDPHDVDDACQATFLVFVRQAAAIRKQDSVASWLHGVARRTALLARRKAKTRHERERGPAEAEAIAEPSAEQAELRGCLDEEIGRLPAKYRAPVVLCYVEGRTVDEAATDLAWPRGSVAGRLARAKEMLRNRLTRRGYAVAALAGLETGLAVEAAAPLPPEFLRATVQAVGQPATVSPSVQALMTGVEQTMTWMPRLWAALAAGVLLLCIAGYAAFAWNPAGEPSGAPGPGPGEDRAPVRDWWLHLASEDKRWALRPDGQERRDLEAVPQWAVPSPDGKRWAYFGKPPPHMAVGKLCIRTGAEEQSWIVPATPDARTLVWSPDGTKIAFTAYKASVRQVFEADVATQKTTQLTTEAKGAHSPAYHPSGTLAWIVDRERSGKVMLGDLILQGERPHTLATREFITGYAFSPDGTKLAYSTFSTLVVQDLATQERRVFKVRDVNPQWNVSFMQLQWRPDGKALAVTFDFLGGVMVGPDGKPPVIPGEDQLAVLPLDGGAITHFAVGANVRLLGWCDPNGKPPVPARAVLPKIDKKVWWLVAHGSQQAWAVREDNGEVRKVPPFSIGADPGIVQSPDGKRQASVDVEGKFSQVFERDLKTGERRQVSASGRHAVRPKYHPDGYLAFVQEINENQGILAPSNLMFHQDGQTWAFVKDKVILDYAFSPDGRYLACCGPDEAVIRDLQTGTAETFLRKDINAAWTASLHSLLWRPDSQAVAVKTVNHNRLLHRDIPVVGDDQVVILVPGEKPRTAKLEPQYDLGLWVDDAVLKKWEQDGPKRKK